MSQGVSERLAVFWEQTQVELRGQELHASAEPERSAAPFVRERVTYRSLGGVEVVALLSKPAGEAGPWPALVTAPGYGGWEFGAELSEAQRGYVILQVYPRMQGQSGPAPADAGHVMRGLDDGPDRYFYRGAYCDVLRGIEYLRTRREVIGSRIALAGTSQGGALAIAAAALDPAVRACVAHLPYLCDLRHNEAFTATPVNTPARLDTFDLFDPVNLAPLLRCPTLLSAGGKDAVSPPRTVHAVYERLPGVKAIFHDPLLTHTSSSAFYHLTWDWISRYL